MDWPVVVCWAFCYVPMMFVIELKIFVWLTAFLQSEHSCVTAPRCGDRAWPVVQVASSGLLALTPLCCEGWVLAGFAAGRQFCCSCTLCKCCRTVCVFLGLSLDAMYVGFALTAWYSCCCIVLCILWVTQSCYCLPCWWALHPNGVDLRRALYISVEFIARAGISRSWAIPFSF